MSPRGTTYGTRLPPTLRRIVYLATIGKRAPSGNRKSPSRQESREKCPAALEPHSSTWDSSELAEVHVQWTESGSSYTRCMNVSLHHITLTVANVKVSAAWYQALLGEAEVVERQSDGWRRIRMAWPGGFILGVTQYEETTYLAPFTHLIAGLDHVGFQCQSEHEVREWAEKISHLGFNRGPLEEVSYGWAVTARDPDNIPVEFFCPRS